jgi:DNA repair exonuclease SbcCD ATPase subunit
MKILRLEAENIKKLKVVAITPAGHIVEITGPNGSGKSSVLDAIFYALAGAKDIPSQPIRRGQLKAHVKLELGEITVIRKFSKDTGTSLVAEAKNGARFPTPQRLLDEMLGKLTFDPLEFSRMDPKKQLDQLRSMVKIDLDLDKLDALNASDFEKRTDLNREIKSLDARGFGFTFPDDTPDEEIDISKLAQELEAAGQTNAGIERVKSDKQSLESKIESQKQLAYDARERARSMRSQAEKILEQATAADTAAENHIAESHYLETQVDAMTIPPPIDTSEVRELINSARGINAAVIRKKQQLAIFADAKQKRAAADALTDAMAARVTAKRDAIAAAKMPIEGLSFGDGEVVYNGLPFAQASSAEQLRISVAVAMAANPKLKVLRIQDGSLLDETNMKLLSEMAEAADYQIWIERVDTSGKVGVVMEDGSVRAVEEKTA